VIIHRGIAAWSVAKRSLDGATLGFVPTMGYLHEGHLSLVKRAKAENERVVVSIFVNPKQFNQSTDLQSYPRMLEADLARLSNFRNIVIFAPDEEEMYPQDLPYKPMPLGQIGSILEGSRRPGHFEGVVHVVHHLFALVQPSKAYFGQKDYQQLAIIRQLNSYYGFGIEIIGCQTVRETDGLAMSSRNLRLSNQDKQKAISISQALHYVQNNAGKDTIDEVKKAAISIIEAAGLVLEYLEIVDPNTLESCSEWQATQVCCIAAFCGEVRLIDNMLCESVL
jgi:pantoate--beta-alanine ligase